MSKDSKISCHKTVVIHAFALAKYDTGGTTFLNHREFFDLPITYTFLNVPVALQINSKVNLTF